MNRNTFVRRRRRRRHSSPPGASLLYELLGGRLCRHHEQLTVKRHNYATSRRHSAFANESGVLVLKRTCGEEPISSDPQSLLVGELGYPWT